VIYEGSRYENETVVRITDASGVSQPAIYVRPDIDAATFRYQLYAVQDGDRLDNLAATFFGDPEFWWVIARANPEVFYPSNLSPGMLLRIPSG
jgi:hypothetical protein